MQIQNPEAIVFDTSEEIEALRDVCDLAFHYAKDYGIAGMSEQRRQRALEFAKRVWGTPIVWVQRDDE